MAAQRILLQLPEQFTLEQVEDALRAHNDNEMDTLCTLLNVATKSNGTACPVQKKWKEIRDVCDAYDDAMQQAIRSSKTT